MRLTVQEWKEMPEIVLPWKGVETGFTLDTLVGLCPDCNTQVIRLRGDLYEFYGVVEMKMGGLCPSCKHLVPLRCRVDTRTGHFSQEVNGQWERKKMITPKQKHMRQTMRFFMPMLMMVLPLIIISFMETSSKWHWICWGTVLFILMGLALMLGKSRKGE